MSDEGDVTEAAPRRKKQGGRGLDSLAMRELRAARKLFKEGDTSAAEAQFLVAQANVLALLDLASAIREARGGDAADE